ncbi:MAG TPA: chemotaxis protein CheW [Coleofasciculaceae cyanobacterium]
MATKQYITFHWQNLYYAIEANLVQEIVPLPKLTIIPEAPTDVIGLLNLRGQFVPILHLTKQQEQTFPGCKISDSIILVQGEKFPVGLVVHEVGEVLELDTESLVKEVSIEFIGDINPALIAGVTKLDKGNLILVHPQEIIRQPDAIFALILEAQQIEETATLENYEVMSPLKQESVQQSEGLSISKNLLNFYELYCPHHSLEERDIFQERADNLKQPIESSTITEELMSVAIVGLGNEYFGLDLGLVREFTDISNLTPIPCCPNHIVGNMNLRGEIVTLVDIRNHLNVPKVPINIGSQAVVIQVDDIVAGLPVDRVLEMADISPSELTELSAILPDSEAQYLRGTAVFQEKIVRVVDLPKLFTEGDLVVNEQA